ncbi:MAG: glycosyltransferase [Candidatus Micrarchaeia archaeon]
MKLAYFTDTYLPNVDGVVNSIVNSKAELAKRGHKVFVFAAGDKQSRVQNLDKTVFFYDSVSFPPYPQYKVAIYPFASTSHVRKVRAKIVHSHAVASMGLAAIAASKSYNIPLLGTFHTMVPLAAKAYTRQRWAKKLVSKIAWQAVSTFYKPYDLVTAPTQTIARLLSHHGIKKVRVVPNGIDIARFNPRVDGNVVRKMLGISRSTKVVVVAGRVSFEKNVEVLISAAKHMKQNKSCPDFKFIITGSGPAKPHCEKLTRQFKLTDTIIFTDFLRSFELPFYYAVGDVFATASTFETQGMAMLEAMACGKLAVGADSLATPEAIKNNENGFLFTPFDSKECADRLCEVLSLPPGKYKAMSKSARLTAEKFSIPKSTDALLQAYSQAL